MPTTGAERLTAGRRPTSERCVLCVDDDREFLKSLEFFLPEQINRGCGEALSYRFIFLADPVEALDVLRELIGEGQTIAMLITDQQMPNMKGTEFLVRARELSAVSARVLLTGHAGVDVAINAINEQILDKYLTKPIESEHDFMLSVKQLLERFELQRQLREQTALIRGLYDFANTLNAAEDLDETLRLAMDFTRSALRCDDVRIILAPANGHPDTAGPASTIGPTSPERGGDPGDRPPIVSGIVERVQDCPWYGVVASESDGPLPPGVAAYAVLESGGNLLGLILAWEPRSGSPFTEESLGTLRYIAASASIALQNQLRRTRLEEIATTRARHLEEARARLQILDRLKSDFLSFVSHELRTPLNYMSVIGMINEDLDRAEHRRMVGIVRDGYKRLERFIMNGVEYFEWLSTRPETSDETTDLTALALAMVSRIKAQDATATDLEVGAPDAPCIALFPWHCAEKLLTILLENAVKFSIGPPRIRVDLGARPGRVTLSVTDHGRGFPPQWAGEIFRPFTITDSRHHRQGTALSLAKAAAMVEAYGGRIRAHSAGVDQGAAFTVELPARAESRARVVDLGARKGQARDSRSGPGPDSEPGQSQAA